MRDVNQEAITGTLSWFKILPLVGFSPNRVKRNLHMRRKKVRQNSWNRHHRPKVVYTDNSMESGKPCEVLSWNHRTSTPHRFETNDVAGRAVRRVKEGTSEVLPQSGLDERGVVTAFGQT